MKMHNKIVQALSSMLITAGLFTSVVTVMAAHV
jgi:hypothetical protein